MPAVPPPATVLVTGVSGFLGSHVARELLDGGYTVVGTVRSTAKGQYLENIFKNTKGKFSFAVVPDIEADGAFDEVVKSAKFDAVEHTASPFHFKARDPDELISPAVKGTKNVLKSIHQYAPTVKRVVITSSVAAITEPNKEPKPYNFTEKDWNEYSIDIVEKQGRAAPVFHWYRASKSLAEQAAWNFVKGAPNVQFDLVTINPPFIFGPTIHEVATAEDLNESNAQFFRFLLHPAIKELATNFYGNSVDVRDVAEAHRLVLENPAAGGERFIISNGPFAFQQVYDALRKANVPNVKAGYPDATIDFTKFETHDGSKATRVLGLKYRSLATQAIDTLASIRERWPNAEKEDEIKYGA